MVPCFYSMAQIVSFSLYHYHMCSSSRITSAHNGTACDNSFSKLSNHHIYPVSNAFSYGCIIIGTIVSVIPEYLYIPSVKK